MQLTHVEDMHTAIATARCDFGRSVSVAFAATPVYGVDGAGMRAHVRDGVLGGVEIPQAECAIEVARGHPPVRERRGPKRAAP